MKPECRHLYSTIAAGLVIGSMALLSGCATPSPNIDTCHPKVKKAVFDELTDAEKEQAGRMAVLVVFSDYDVQVEGAFRSERGYKDSSAAGAAAGEAAGAGMGGLLLASLTVTAPYASVPLVTLAGTGIGTDAVGVYESQNYEEYKPRDRITALKKSAECVLDNCNAHYELLRIAAQTPELQPSNGIELLAKVPGVDAEAKVLLREAIHQHDSYLELTLEQIKIHYGRHREESPWHSTVDVHINIRARMIRVGDKAVLSDHLYEARNMVSHTRPLTALLANRAALLKQTVEQGMKQNTSAIAADYLKHNRAISPAAKHSLAVAKQHL